MAQKEGPRARGRTSTNTTTWQAHRYTQHAHVCAHMGTRTAPTQATINGRHGSLWNTLLCSAGFPKGFSSLKQSLAHIHAFIHPYTKSHSLGRLIHSPTSDYHSLIPLTPSHPHFTPSLASSSAPALAPSHSLCSMLFNHPR